MYLKSIEVQGFKSFANKIVFQFHNGITGIVGPNGSGKSNVADAVRWVLGEQRIKQLRGSSMQDVIFSGTENRKPLSYAYVAITLDNSDHALAIDYDQVTIARRIYRSGESEYLINGSICRLKDVNELFYDTGIGKEGYSIIGQGQIDKILSGKPEERRELFDEAAGIVKFKRRKNAAQNKLENEKQNLIRLNDILAELEKQVGPLEKQSETAKVFLKKRDELRTLDINVFLLENLRIKNQLKEIEGKYDIASDDLAGTKERYEKIREEYEQVQEALEELEKTIEEARATLTDTGLVRQRLEGEIDVLEEQIRSAGDSSKHLIARRDALTEDIAQKEQNKQEILVQKKDADDQVSEITGTAEEMRGRLSEVQKSIEELNTAIENGKNAIINELNQRAQIKNQIGRLDTMTEQIGIRRAELQNKLLHAKSEEAAREESRLALEDQLAAVTEEIRVMEENVAERELALGDVREALVGMDMKLRKTQVLYQQENSRLEALANLTERYEGYGGSVKKVMEMKEREKGIAGVVADIIKVEEKYEVAIETALGGNIQNIVTDDEETAKKMIKYLKVNRFGRATFLPLTSITKQQEFKQPEVLTEKGVIGMADRLVSVEPVYSDVAKAMLGRIVVVDTVDNAVRIARKYDYGIRMVTLEGELLVPGGAISGGAFKNNSNLLGRRRELDELEKKTRELAGKIEEINTEIEQTKSQRNKMRMELEGVKNDIQRKTLEQNTVRLNISQLKSRMAEGEESVLDLRREENDLALKVQEIEAEKQSITLELSRSEETEEATKKIIIDNQSSLEELYKQESEASALVGDWELKVEKMLQAQTFMQANIDRLNGEMERSERELEQIAADLMKIEEGIGEKKEHIEEIRKTISASHEQQNESELKLRENIAKREALHENQKDFFNVREQLAEQIAGLDREVYRLNAQREKLEESIEAQINYMWDEYEITLSDAASLRDENMTDLSAMKREIAGLKDQIKKLGDVNVNAIEDYKNLMERYTFMKTQHDDLVEAQKVLEDIIRELDAAMRKQFTEKFAEISKEFDKVFKELFGGGKGTLELMEDEDILEAGVRIIAQPPGKKLQNMMQLSGGEKALSAIALLFAIQNLKPSPFCLLDEIEAALDDSNVTRFAKYLHKLTRNTQFIVITHRRGTMELVDRLYGITMQEKGVSTLVSVNLIDKELTQ